MKTNDIATDARGHITSGTYEGQLTGYDFVADRCRVGETWLPCAGFSLEVELGIRGTARARVEASEAGVSVTLL